MSNYGEYRSAREEAKTNGNWDRAFWLAIKMPRGEERDAALRDWWLTETSAYLSPCDLRIEKNGTRSGGYRFGAARRISHLTMTDDCCEISYHEERVFRGSDVELPKLAHKFGRLLVERLLESFEAEIKQDIILWQLLDQYRESIQSPKDSLERRWDIHLLSNVYLRISPDDIDERQQHSLLESIAYAMLVCLLEYDYYLEGVALHYQNAYNAERRSKGEQEYWDTIEDVGSEYMTIILQAYKQTLR